MTNAGPVVGIALPLDDALAMVPQPVSAMVVGVDNNHAREAGRRFGQGRRAPVIFAMLSLDGLRAQVFCQLPGGPCLSCTLPNSDPDQHTPCAAASAASCELAAAHAVHMTVGALCGFEVPIWRETSLDGSTERVGNPTVRLACICQIRF